MSIATRRFIPVLLGAFACLLLSSCVSRGTSSEVAVSSSFSLPKYLLQMQGKATYAKSLGSSLPKKAYVFPPLRIDMNGKPVEALQHRIGADGRLVWGSPVPRAAEVKSVVEQALRRRGFVIVGFESLGGTSREHGVLVVNPYFTQQLGVEGQEFVERVFVRLTGSTFPASMDPAGKIDRFNQEAIVFFDDNLSALDVAKRVLAKLVQTIGQSRQWQDRLHIFGDS